MWKTLGYPLMCIGLAVGMALVGFMVFSNRWTNQQLATHWRRQISESDDRTAVNYVRKLGQLNEAAIPHLVELLHHDREAIRSAARDTLSARVTAWQRDSANPSAQQALRLLAQELAEQP